MNIRDYSNFLFDLDGTLIDSFGDIKHSIEGSYDLVLKQTVVLLRHHVGPPLLDMIETLTPGLPEQSKQALVEAFRYSYDNSNYGLTTVIPGVRTLLSGLCDKRLFLVTNKPYNPTLRITDKLNIHRYFKDILSPDKFGGKPYSKTQLIKCIIDSYNLDPKQSIMIGDSRHDVAAATANAMDSIFLTDGYEDIDSIQSENPTYIFKNITHLQTKINQFV